MTENLYYVSTLYEAKNGYCTYSSTVSNNGCLKFRQKKFRTTPDVVAAINKKNSLELCKDTVNANFEPTDWHLTITFPSDLSDKDRIHQSDNARRRLRRLHNNKGHDFVYMFSWGRGDEVDKLHIHMCMKQYNDISTEDITRAVTKNGKYQISVYHEKIQTCPVYTADNRTKALNDFVDYVFYNNYDELTTEDRKVIKHRWYGSQGLEHTKPKKLDSVKFEDCPDSGSFGDVTISCCDEHDHSVSGNPRKKNAALIKLLECNLLDDKAFNRILGFRIPKYHIVEQSVRIIKDSFGHKNIYMQLIKMGSEIDVKYHPKETNEKKHIYLEK